MFGCLDCERGLMLKDMGLLFEKVYVPELNMSHTRLDDYSAGKSAKEELLSSLIVFQSAARGKILNTFF